MRGRKKVGTRGAEQGERRRMGRGRENPQWVGRLVWDRRRVVQEGMKRWGQSKVGW